MPQPGGHFKYAKAKYNSVYGMVESGWRKEEGKYHFKINIPSNCEADIQLPDGTSKTVGAGGYEFEM